MYIHPLVTRKLPSTTAQFSTYPDCHAGEENIILILILSVGDGASYT